MSASGIRLYSNSGASSKGGRPRSTRVGRKAERSRIKSPRITSTPRSRALRSRACSASALRSMSAPPWSTRSPCSTPCSMRPADNNCVRPRQVGPSNSRPASVVSTFIVEAGCSARSAPIETKRWPGASGQRGATTTATASSGNCAARAKAWTSASKAVASTRGDGSRTGWPDRGDGAGRTGCAAAGATTGCAAARPATAQIKAANSRQLNIKSSQSVKTWKGGRVKTWGPHNAWRPGPRRESTRAP